MSTALYRRYRPDSFEHVIGQDHVTVPLRAALDANKVTHAYLFSGPRGCGKTTSARILARCLNCVQGPTASPCGTCDSCRELATGGPGSLDVVEIDAASHGGVDDARELRERATFAPVRDRYKVFIIDEAHMVTQAGFNALLKLVEEPPEHVKFVFATTEPDKVLGTIRSRTHHYPFRLVPPDVLEPYLAHLANGEGIDIAPGVLNLVIRAGGGSVRDTLSVLDQLMAGAVNGHLPYSQAVALLGYTDVALLDESVDALAGGDGAAVYRVVERMVDSGHDPRRFVEDLLQRLRDLLIISVAGEGAVDVLTGVPADQLERMMTQARNWGPRALSHAADLTDKALRSMVGATSPRLQLELLIGRILVPVSAAPVADAVQGTVGLVGGGAPHEHSPAEGGATRSTGGAPFGAAQAKERLQAMRSQGDSASTIRSPESKGLAAQEQTPRPEPARQQSTLSELATSAAPQQAAAAWDALAPTPPQITERQPSSGQQLPPTPSVATTSTSESNLESTSTPNSESIPVQAPGQTPVQAPGQTPVQVPGQATMPRSGAGSDADMLRQRWPEVIERLSSISRVAWALLNGNGQLGGVDGQQAVVVLPTQGMVDTFVNGQRGPAIEQAIYEATGLKLAVVAQVGQAQGGATVTTPTATAARQQTHQSQDTPSYPDPHHVPQQQRGAEGHAGAVRQQAPFRAETRKLDPATQNTSNPHYSNAQTENSGQTQPDDWPSPPSVVTPVQYPSRENPAEAAYQLAEQPTSDRTPNASAAPASVASEGDEKPNSQSDTAPAQAENNGTAKPSEKLSGIGQAGVFNTYYDSSAAVEDKPHLSAPEDISWPTPAPVPSSTPTTENLPTQTPPVTWDAPAPKQTMEEPSSEKHEVTQPQTDIWEPYVQGATTWADTNIPASNVTFAQDEPEPAHSSHRPHLEVISNGVPDNTSPEEEHVNAADDDSASIDDDDIEVDMTVGLDAVREILGATVIDERVEESSW